MQYDIFVVFFLLIAIIFLDFIPLLKGGASTAEIVIYASLGVVGFGIMALGAAGIDLPAPANLFVKISEIILK